MKTDPTPNASSRVSTQVFHSSNQFFNVNQAALARQNSRLSAPRLSPPSLLDETCRRKMNPTEWKDFIVRVLDEAIEMSDDAVFNDEDDDGITEQEEETSAAARDSTDPDRTRL